MKNSEWLKTLTNEQLVEWMEDFAEAYVCFWISPPEECDFSHRDDDKRIQLDWLDEEHYDENKEFQF